MTHFLFASNAVGVLSHRLGVKNRLGINRGSSLGHHLNADSEGKNVVEMRAGFKEVCIFH